MAATAMTTLDARGTNTVAAMHPMTPIHFSNGELLKGNWTGHELTYCMLVNGSFCGPHYLLRLGHTVPIGDNHPAAFRATFVVRYPLDVITGSKEEADEARRIAQTFMDMLNLRRNK